jgi:hypothetical protein
MISNGVRVTDLDELILAQEAVLRERVLPELEWDENEASRLVDEVLGRPRERGYELA